MFKKISFIKLIQIWVIIILLSMGITIVFFDIVISHQYFNSRIHKIRTNYITRQKEIIKSEVMHVVDIINYEREQNENAVKEENKKRVFDGYSIAYNIYKQNKDLKNRDEIKKMILDALSPIRFEGGAGFYFILDMDGTMISHPFQTELEGKNQLEIRDLKGKYIARDMIKIVKQSKSNEGFYEFYWSLAGVEEEEGEKKISFIKLFKPYNWIIGAGIYVNDINKRIKQNLLVAISKIRFGKEGYIFVNKLNGDALVSNGILFSGTKKLWEVSNKPPEKIKDIFKKEHKAALKPQGDFIYYSWVKLTGLNKEVCKKTSFVYGLPSLKWLVGAGVYLDDIEKDIALLQAEQNNKIREKVIYSSLITVGIVIFFLFLLSRLNIRFKNDFNLFLEFFNKAVKDNEEIDLDQVHFIELDQIADNTNKILQEKLRVKESLVGSKEALRKSENKYKRIVESSYDLIWEINIEGILIYVSPQMEAILGYKVTEVVGKVIFDLMPAEESERVYKYFKKLISLREALVSLESVFIHKDDRFVILETSGIPIFSKEDEIVGYSGVSRDITKRKNSEDELQKIQQLKSIGTLAGGIAHDFNNILTGLYGNISFAREEIEKDHVAFESLVNAEKSMDRAISLANQLLTFAKGGSPVKEVVRLDTLVEEVVRFYLSGSNVKFNFEQMNEILWLSELDKGQMQQVFSNLTVNARQAMHSGGELYVRLENVDMKVSQVSGIEPGKYIKITVRDSGEGIDQKYINRIFDPYFSTKKEGTGIGLATTYSIIHKHGGHISVFSELGKGTAFTIYLPASTSLKLEEKIVRPDTQYAKSKDSPRVLIMDDDILICGLVKKMLSVSGFFVETALDGIETIEMYKKSLDDSSPFDVIIMDLTIPGGMGGQEAVKEILSINPDAKVVVSSGYSNDSIVADCQKHGFVASISKPFMRSELVQVINSIL